jgi:hypothetical protein
MSNFFFEIDLWLPPRVNVMIATEGHTSMKPVHGILTNHHLHDMFPSCRKERQLRAQPALIPWIWIHLNLSSSDKSGNVRNVDSHSHPKKNIYSVIVFDLFFRLNGIGVPKHQNWKVQQVQFCAHPRHRIWRVVMGTSKPGADSWQTDSLLWNAWLKYSSAHTSVLSTHQ